jgi:hypothetical protein
MSVYSEAVQLGKIRDILSSYVRLPFSGDSIPGAIMEGLLAHVRGGQRLNTYDFVDVVDRQNKVGWQVKSTKAATPVTWKRAKIPNAEELVKDSRNSADGLQALGDAIIHFCNRHAQESLALYRINEIGYSRLILFDDKRVVYFERLLCTRERPQLFDPIDFSWRWSEPKKTKKKEQLSALHGIHRRSGEKWWAWHGLGENQLHFSGEGTWWPKKEDTHSVTFTLPSDSDKLSVEAFLALLDKATST